MPALTEMVWSKPEMEAFTSIFRTFTTSLW